MAVIQRRRGGQPSDADAQWSARHSELESWTTKIVETASHSPDMDLEAMGWAGRQEQIRSRMDEQDQRSVKWVLQTRGTPQSWTWLMSLEHFTPYQLILGTFTILYALRHLDDLFGLGGEFRNCTRYAEDGQLTLQRLSPWLGL